MPKYSEMHKEYQPPCSAVQRITLQTPDYILFFRLLQDGGFTENLELFPLQITGHERWCTPPVQRIAFTSCS